MGPGVRRDDERFSFINIKSSGSYPRVPNLAYPARVLSNEGALLEASLKWDRAKAWPGRGNPSRPDAAPEVVPRKHRLGRPWVSVRAHYRALPLKLAGRGQACGAKSPRVATSPEERTRVLRRRGGAPNRRCRVLLSPGDPGDKPRLVDYAPFGAPLPLTRGRQTKSPPRAAARERGPVAVCNFSHELIPALKCC